MTTTTPGTVDVTIEIDAPPAAVFAAWANRDAALAWSSPGPGWEIAADRFTFREGDSDIWRFGPDGGPEFVNENRYALIEPGRRIVHHATLATGGRLTFAAAVAVTFEPHGSGTRLRLVEQGLYLDDTDSADDHRAGWEAMLCNLRRYVAEAEPAPARS